MKHDEIVDALRRTIENHHLNSHDEIVLHDAMVELDRLAVQVARVREIRDSARGAAVVWPHSVGPIVAALDRALDGEVTQHESISPAVPR